MLKKCVVITVLSPAYGLSTLATIVAQFCDCRQKRRIVAQIVDYSLQCGQGFIEPTDRHPVWTNSVFYSYSLFVPAVRLSTVGRRGVAPFLLLC